MDAKQPERTSDIDVDWSDPELSAALSDHAAIAATVAGVPVTLAAIVEPDHDRIVANYYWAIQSLPKESSLARQVVEQGTPVVVEDMTAEPSLASHPLATGEPFIRFFAGCPIPGPDGSPIGALLTLDKEPKRLAPRQLQSLEKIARLIGGRIAIGSGGAPRAVRTEDSEQRIRDLFESLDDIILTMFDDGRIFNINRAGAEHLGFFDESDQPDSLWDIVANDYVAELKETFDGVVRTQTKQPVQTVLVSAYNKRVIVEGTLMPTVEDGSTHFVRVIFRDVTDRIDTERELGKTKDAALEAARAKSSFLTNLSHEIRTPMNIVIGMLDLLLGTELDEEQKDLAQTALSNAEGFLNVIDNLIHVSKLESGNLTVTEADFDPRSTLSRLVDVSNIMAAERGMKIELDVDSNIPLVLRGDVARVRQVLGNLVSNAVKFNRDGTAVVTARVADETPTHLIVRFEVADDGVGIEQSQLGAIFEPFTQVDSSMTREETGAGVGLTTAKQLVELMGGSIGVDSKVGQGSSFWFTIPFRKISSDEMNVTARKRGFPGLKALILDRSETSRKIIEYHFRDWGLKPRMETSTQAAMERLRSQASLGEPYDIFFFDFRLESQTGFELAEAIRADENLADTKLITMIPLGDDLDDMKLRDAGLSGYLHKPVEQWELFDKISSALATRIEVTTKRREQEIERPMPTQKEGLRILLAEDKPLNQKLALSQLKTLGLQADVVTNGQEVLDKLRDQEYDVILMDCQMPVLDGYEATRKLRQIEKDSSHRTHIIALTAHAVDGEREKCIAAGMDDYLSKPTKQSDLADALSRVN